MRRIRLERSRATWNLSCNIELPFRTTGLAKEKQSKPLPTWNCRCVYRRAFERLIFITVYKFAYFSSPTTRALYMCSVYVYTNSKAVIFLPFSFGCFLCIRVYPIPIRPRILYLQVSLYIVYDLGIWSFPKLYREEVTFVWICSLLVRCVVPSIDYELSSIWIIGRLRTFAIFGCGEPWIRDN